jgi:predicted DNA-binding protein
MIRAAPKLKGKKVVAIQVRLPEELDEALAEEATRRGVTKSDIIRAWISALPKPKPRR